MRKTTINALRESFHPLFYLRKNALYRRLTENLRIPITARVDQIKYRVYVDFIRNMTIVLSGHTGEDVEMIHFARILKPLGVTQFWDVGANVGVYSFLFWTLNEAGAAVLFEPDPYNASLLKRSMRAHPKLHGTLIEKAVSEHEGAANFSIDNITGATGSIYERGAASFIQKHHKVVPKQILVQTTTLDAAAKIYPAPQLIKVDVEGAESLVFAGATELIANHRPAFVFEADATFDLTPLHASGYTIFDFRSLRPINVATHNNLALHPEHHAAALSVVNAS